MWTGEADNSGLWRRADSECAMIEDRNKKGDSKEAVQQKIGNIQRTERNQSWRSLREKQSGSVVEDLKTGEFGPWSTKKTKLRSGLKADSLEQGGNIHIHIQLRRGVCGVRQPNQERYQSV